jgi:hypothetical protein
MTHILSLPSLNFSIYGSRLSFQRILQPPVVQRESLNTSTHDLVMAELPLALGNVPKTAENHTEVPTKINWSKCDIQAFQQL